MIAFLAAAAAAMTHRGCLLSPAGALKTIRRQDVGISGAWMPLRLGG